MPGTFAHLERLPGGAIFVLLLNREVPGEQLVGQLRRRLAETTRWPDGDLFERY
jgi:hypothetical protein